MAHTATTHPQQLRVHNQRRLSPRIDRRDGGPCPADFPPGLFVEVKTKEEGFTRTYFSATVLQPSKASPKKSNRKNSNKIFVEYHNLLAHEDESDRLREYVDVSFVRPVPPFQEIVKGFKPNDVVDAFFKDSWWIGVVKRVVKNGKSFIVTFEEPPDEQELRLDELRVHWDWVDGRWVRPGNQSIAAKMFDVGSKVEVSFDKEECHDAWFPATVLKDLGNGCFLVECNNVNTDEKAQPCEVTINHIRPNPPLLKDTKIRLLEKVDAHIGSGWWAGTTIRVLENSRYTVFFKKTKQQKEFDNCELRPHVDWTDGKWFTGSKEITVRSSDGRIARHRTTENRNASTPTGPVVNKSSDRKDTRGAKTPSLKLFQQLTPDNQKTSDETSSVSKRNQSLSDSRNALSQSLEKDKEGGVPSASQQDSHHNSVKDMSCVPVIPLSVDISAALNSTEDQLSDNHSSGKKFPRKARNEGATVNVDGKINSTSSNMKKCSMPVLQLDIPMLDVGVPSSVGNIVEGGQNRKKEETKRPFIIGLPCPVMGNAAHEKSRVKRSHCPNSKKTVIVASEKKQKLNGSPVQAMKDSEPLENGDSSEKRTRGRRRRVLIASNETPMIDDLIDKDEHRLKIPEVDMTMDVSLDKLTNDRSHPKTRKGSMTSSPLKRGRRGITAERNSLQVQDPPEFNPNSMEVDKVIFESLSNGFDDVPLSKWIEELQPPPAIEYSGLAPVSNTQECMENGEKQTKIIVIEDDIENIPESGGLQAEDSVVVASEQENLPFVKTNIFWKTIESVEAFQKVPQRPHFKPLEQVKESLREGIAVGYMVTFSSFVEKAFSLQFDSPKSTTDDIMETLMDLEGQGFDVKFAQDRVNSLLLAKEREEKLVIELKKLDGNISEQNREKSKIEEEMSKLQDKLNEKDVEIASMRAKMKETQESIRNVRCEFEGDSFSW